jgi:hypothetical protein
MALIGVNNEMEYFVDFSKLLYALFVDMVVEDRVSDLTRALVAKRRKKRIVLFI